MTDEEYNQLNTLLSKYVISLGLRRYQEFQLTYSHIETCVNEWEVGVYEFNLGEKCFKFKECIANNYGTDFSPKELLKNAALHTKPIKEIEKITGESGKNL